MGCGASSPEDTVVSAPPVQATPAAYSPPPKDGESSEWSLTVPASSLAAVTNGATIPSMYLVVHDNKVDDAPRMSVIDIVDGCMYPVQVVDPGLAGAKDLEALLIIDKEVAGAKWHAPYIAVTSIGDAWMFKVSRNNDVFVAHDVSYFKLVPPAGLESDTMNCEGVRAFVDAGMLFIEWCNRGGFYDGVQLVPWVARMPLDLAAIASGYFVCDPAACEVSYLPAVIDGDATVRQGADLGQAVGMAKYGQLVAAAYDDEATETYFRSYIMEQLPGEGPDNVVNLKPLFKIYDCKIEGIMDVTPDVSIYSTDDESKGAFVCVFSRSTGLSWRVDLTLPEGADPQHYGMSGISPIDPSVTSMHSDDEHDEPREPAPAARYQRGDDEAAEEE